MERGSEVEGDGPSHRIRGVIQWGYGARVEGAYSESIDPGRRGWMTPIALNHTIVPSRDKAAAAEFFARIFGLRYGGPTGHFAPVSTKR